MSDRALDEQIARELPTAWPPFFGRHGRLRPVQRLAMPPILSGRDVLVIAPTASGKTEAACAPLVERNFDRPRWTVLYISPTRALTNDLHERLLGPAGQLGLTVRRRTGDHREVLEGANLLLTTPESFDSLLCRGRLPGGRHALGDVRAVVLDEIHLIHGTARGEQVRWLLRRLERLRRQIDIDRDVRATPPQIVALSATVPDPDAIAVAFLRTGAFIARAAGSRPIEVIAPDVDQPDTETAITAFARDVVGPQKILVFSNSRKRVDALARSLGQRLAPLRFEVRAHHGSLSLEEREDSERALKLQPRIVVCATMTLEIGIDIGDVDLVVLDAPAPSVSSLLQRVGRGNRRTGTTRVMLCSGSMVEPLIHAAMLDAAKHGDLGTPDHGPSFAVARQQIASYLFQSPQRSRPYTQLIGLVADLLPDVDAPALVAHLISIGDLEEDSAGVRLGREWLEMTRRGEIHSNIEDTGGYQVVDERTGGLIGKGIRTQSGRGLGIAGKMLEVKGWQEFQIVVQRARTNEAAVGEWSYVSRGWMQGAGQPEAVRRYLGILPGTWPVLPGGRRWCIFHFGGARRKAVLELIARFARGPGFQKADEWCLWLSDETLVQDGPPRWLTQWTPAQLALLLVGENLDRMERLLGRPAGNRHLPPSLRVREVTEWLRLPEEQRSFNAMDWSPSTDPGQRTALQLIASSLGG